jgi:hypothetical protein
MFGIDRGFVWESSLRLLKRNRTKQSAKAMGIIAAGIFAYLIDYFAKMRLSFM